VAGASDSPFFPWSGKGDGACDASDPFHEWYDGTAPIAAAHVGHRAGQIGS